MKLRTLLPVALLAVASASAVAIRPAEAQVGSARVIAEDLKIKAAFVFNFPKFVEWPAHAFNAADRFSVVILGDDALAPAIEDAFLDARVGGRPVVVSRVWALNDQLPCHMLYIAESEERDLGGLLNTLKSRPVLTVATIRRFAERGGMIHIVIQDGKGRFIVNKTAAARAGVSVSSRLLGLAMSVIQ